jgi:hypothetical protein
MRFLDADKLQIGFKFIFVKPDGLTNVPTGFNAETIAGQIFLVSDSYLYFKGFFDKNEISMQYETFNVAYNGADSLQNVPYRVLKTYNLDFSVYSEHIDEAIVNYRKLHKMINALAFNSKERTADASAAGNNIFSANQAINKTANLRVAFRANPLIFSNNPETNTMDILTMKFSFSNIDDHGYVLYPFNKNDNERPTPIGNYNNELLIPLAFKISLNGQISPSVEAQKITESSAAGLAASQPAANGGSGTNETDSRITEIKLEDLNRLLPQWNISSSREFYTRFITYINTNEMNKEIKKRISEYINNSDITNLNIILTSAVAQYKQQGGK